MPEIVFLGTNGWFDTDTGNTICVLVKARDFQVVLDAGNGIRSLSAHADLSRPTFIFVSHFHLDHVIGLHTLGMNRFSGGLAFIVEEGGTAHLSTLLDLPFSAPLKRLPFPTRIIEVPAHAGELPFRASFLPLRHVPTSQGIRMEIDGAVIAFCLDTGYCGNAVQLCKGADLAILECTLPSGTRSETHLTPETCASIAREAGAKKLALTHFEALSYPTRESRAEAARIVGGLFPSFILSADGMSVEI
jgi:ribonuclease BN (tRNA processing enzyme)